jgi:hypothetical protein
MAHEEVCGVLSFNLVIYFWQTFTNGLVAYTSAYPIICKKSWQRGAQPQLITTFINNSLHMFCPDLSVSNLILQ